MIFTTEELKLLKEILQFQTADLAYNLTHNIETDDKGEFALLSSMLKKTADHLRNG